MDSRQTAKKTIFISDVHISEDDPERTQRFLLFLERHREEMERLFILGDFFDFWIGPRSSRVDVYRRVLAKLKELVSSRVPVTYVAGNRDFFGLGALEKMIGVEVHREAGVIELGGKKVYLTHGDVFRFDGRLIKSGRSAWLHPLIEWGYLRIPARWAHFIGHWYRGRRERLREAQKRTLPTIPRSAVERLFSLGIDVVICGHTHQSRKITFPQGPGDKEQEKVVYTVGAWYDDTPYLEYADGRFTLKSDEAP